jgi:hypothetical protein
MSWEMTKEQWAKLPLLLRQRWWRETDYGLLAPNEELKQAIRDALNKDKS